MVLGVNSIKKSHKEDRRMYYLYQGKQISINDKFDDNMIKKYDLTFGDVIYSLKVK
jgi:hypothetical protein